MNDLADIEPVHVAAFVETLQGRLSAPSVKLHLAAIRMLFDWLVVGEVVASNPASAVRGPRRRGHLDAGRGRVCPGTAQLGAAARERCKRHEMPCHHNLETYLHAYIVAAGLTDGKAWLFQSVPGRSGKLSGEAMQQPDVYRRIGRHAKTAQVHTKAGCHSFRATGIT